MELETDRVGGLGEVIRHMTRPDQVECRRRFEWLDVDFHLTSTDQPGILSDVVRQLVLGDHRLPGLDGVARLPERLVLIAAAPDRAHDSPVWKHQHLGTNPLWGRALRTDDRHEGRRFPAPQRLRDCLEHILVPHGVPV